MGKKQRDKRQFPRVNIGCKTKGRVTAVCDASLLDVSRGGVLIEHVQVIRPGSTSSLDLDLLGKRLSVKCRVARSVLHRTEMQSDGAPVPVYHTGLEFIDLPEETGRVVCDYIRSIIKEGNGAGALMGDGIAVEPTDHEGPR